MSIFITSVITTAAIIAAIFSQSCFYKVSRLDDNNCNAPCTVNFSGHGTMTEDQANVKWDYREGSVYVFRIKP